MGGITFCSVFYTKTEAMENRLARRRSFGLVLDRRFNENAHYHRRRADRFCTGAPWMHQHPARLLWNVSVGFRVRTQPWLRTLCVGTARSGGAYYQNFAPATPYYYEPPDSHRDCDERPCIVYRRNAETAPLQPKIIAPPPEKQPLNPPSTISRSSHAAAAVSGHPPHEEGE